MIWSRCSTNQLYQYAIYYKETALAVDRIWVNIDAKIDTTKQEQLIKSQICGSRKFSSMWKKIHTVFILMNFRVFITNFY